MRPADPRVAPLREELRDATPERRVQILAELNDLGDRQQAVPPPKESR